MSNLLYSWSFDDSKNRGALWYIITFSISLGLIIWGFLSQQYGMSFIIMLLIGFFFYLENNSSNIIDVQVNDKGIKIADSFYPFSSISSYSIIYNGEQALLLRLKIRKKIGGINVDININNSIINDLRELLSNFLEEDKKEELTFIEKLLRILKI